MDSRLWNRRQIDRDLDIRRKQTFPMMHCKLKVTTMQCAHNRVLKILFLRHWMFWLQKTLNFKDLTTTIWKRKTVHLFSIPSFSNFFPGLEFQNFFVRIQVSERTLGEIMLQVKEWLLIHIRPWQKLCCHGGFPCTTEQLILIWDIEDITWPRRGTKFLFECWKTFHEWAQRTSEIFFFNTRREISHLQATINTVTLKIKVHLSPLVTIIHLSYHSALFFAIWLMPFFLWPVEFARNLVYGRAKWT